MHLEIKFNTCEIHYLLKFKIVHLMGGEGKRNKPNILQWWQKGKYRSYL